MSGNDGDDPRPRRDDPWSQVEDIRGDAHYVALGIGRDATAAEIKSAYRAAAREHHPDKGGDAEEFKLYAEAYAVPTRTLRVWNRIHLPGPC